MNSQKRLTHILRQQRNRIDHLLARLENSEDLEEITDDDLGRIFRHKLGPFYEDYLIDKLAELKGLINQNKFQCRLSKEEAMEFMIAPSSKGNNQSKTQIRKSGLKEIRDFTKGAEELIIIDPYIFAGGNKKSNEYLEEFKKSSRIDNPGLSKIHIIYSSSHGRITKSIKSGIKKLASNNSCKISNYDTDKFHDRIWIKNRSEAIIVGTSFGGVGNRLCFILELPHYDLKNLLEHLTNEKVYSNIYS